MTYDEIVTKTITEFNSRKLSLMNLSEKQRHNAFLIEQAFHDAAIVDDRSVFMKKVMDWRSLILKGTS